jgi:hypothetical protein
MAKCTDNPIVVVDCYFDDDCWVALVQCGTMHKEKNIVAVQAKLTGKSEKFPVKSSGCVDPAKK